MLLLDSLYRCTMRKKPASDASVAAIPRMMAMTTLLSGLFWGMMRSLVLTGMHFQMLGLKQVII